MRRRVTVIGAAETARELIQRDYADVVEDVREMAGSHVVVVNDASSSEEIARRAPAAVVVVTGGAEACARLLAETLFPRARVIGTAGNGAGRLVEAVVLDRKGAVQCLARTRDGGNFVPTVARIGARGIEELL